MQRLFLVFVMCLAFTEAMKGQQFKEWSFQAPAGWQVTTAWRHGCPDTFGCGAWQRLCPVVFRSKDGRQSAVVA